MTKRSGTLISAEELEELVNAPKLWQPNVFVADKNLSHSMQQQPRSTKVAQAQVPQATQSMKSNTPPTTPVVTHSVLASELQALQAQVMAEARQEGWEKGYEEGFLAGKAAGFESEKTNMQAKIQSLEILNQEIVNLFKALQTQLANDVVSLSLQIAKKVVQCEINTHPSMIEPVVRQCLDVLPENSHHLILQLNPNDLILVQEHLGEELHAQAIKLSADPKIMPGGCQLASNMGSIDALLQTRWRRVLKGLGKDWPLIDKEEVFVDNESDHTPLDFQNNAINPDEQ